MARARFVVDRSRSAHCSCLKRVLIFDFFPRQRVKYWNHSYCPRSSGIPFCLYRPSEGPHAKIQYVSIPIV
jgi:hypothetical protein